MSFLAHRKVTVIFVYMYGRSLPHAHSEQNLQPAAINSLCYVAVRGSLPNTVDEFSSREITHTKVSVYNLGKIAFLASKGIQHSCQVVSTAPGGLNKISLALFSKFMLSRFSITR
ncbi:hypothetical protein PoB_004076500 [Plakobranchus ocellatus]|uniref:Uncharacterized protein n=1 Tax=Plakobranchus ocellatus TaxID=259542 RepID=A0AAV4B100_9GAST|nr:hypothetical protein PoB_004076500 [Plakobranchus ocellatus]